MKGSDKKILFYILDLFLQNHYLLDRLLISDTLYVHYYSCISVNKSISIDKKNDIRLFGIFVIYPIRT